MGKLSRDKGKRWEREVADFFRALFPEHREHIKRGWQTRSGRDGADVDGHPDFWIECKVGKQTNPRAALTQAEEASDGRIPIAVCKDDRKPAFVAMRLTDFKRLVELLRGDT